MAIIPLTATARYVSSRTNLSDVHMFVVVCLRLRRLLSKDETSLHTTDWSFTGFLSDTFRVSTYEESKARRRLMHACMYY
jgi:hypothetical protein